MSYARQSMLNIRGMRQDRAHKDLAHARSARNAAARELAEKQDDRRRYEKDKEERRDRVYAAVMGRPVKIEDLDQARTAVTRIDEEGLLLEEAERKAEDALAERERETEGARIRFVAATRDFTKIDEHRKSWMEEDSREQERIADSEMEEFAGRRTGGEDDDTFA